MAATTPLWKPDGEGVTSAALALKEGKVVSIPTETVYGLAADATNDQAVAAVFEIKSRPTFNPLIIHISDEDAAWQLVKPNPIAKKLAARFWPGPLTLVLPKQSNSPVSALASAGLDTLAVRVPAHPTVRLLLMTAFIPLAAPSANPSGSISPTNAEHVCDAFDGKIAGVLDGGPCAVGLESTVIGFEDDKPVLLRAGGLSIDGIEAIAGPLGSSDGSGVTSPGMLVKHYAPKTPLRLNARELHEGEVLLGFGSHMPAPLPRGSLNLSEQGDLKEAASNLFAMLHQLDKLGVQTIAVMPVPNTGLGLAINDRLTRGAKRDD